MAVRPYKKLAFNLADAINQSLSTAKLQRALASAPLQLRAATDALSHWFSVDETSQSETLRLLHVDKHSQSGE